MPHAAVAVIGKQMSTVPFAQTVAVTFGAVRRQMLTVTVPVAVQPAMLGDVTVYVKVAVLPVLPVAL